MVVCQIPLHRVFLLLLHVQQCSFCKQLPLLPDTNDLDFFLFFTDISDVLLYCLSMIVPFHRTLSCWFSGSSMKLSDAVVLAELGHQRILKFPSIVSVYFLRESKLPAKLRQALQCIFSLLIFQWVKP